MRARQQRRHLPNGRSAETQLPQLEPQAPAPAPGANGDAAIDLATAATLREQYGGGRLLVSDIRTGLLLLNAARHRVIGGVFGVPREQENLLTLVLVLMLADAAGRKAQELMQGPPLPPADGALLGMASVRELLCGIAGPSSRDTPMTGTLLTIAVLGGAAAPVIVKSLRGARAASHRVSVGFHRRYGYLVDPGSWRARRAAAIEAPRSSAQA